MHKKHLVAVGEAVPVVHGLGRPHDRKHDVAVAHEGNPAVDRVAASGNRQRTQVTRPQPFLLFVFDLHLAVYTHLADRGRRPQVVEDRLDAGKTVDAHQLLVVEGAVAFAELHVPFVGQLAQLVVIRHGVTSFR